MAPKQSLKFERKLEFPSAEQEALSECYDSLCQLQAELSYANGDSTNDSFFRKHDKFAFVREQRYIETHSYDPNAPHKRSEYQIVKNVNKNFKVDSPNRPWNTKILLEDTKGRQTTFLKDMKIQQRVQDVIYEKRTLLEDISDKRNTIMKDIEVQQRKFRRNIGDQLRALRDVDDKQKTILEDIRNKQNNIQEDIHNKQQDLGTCIQKRQQLQKDILSQQKIFRRVIENEKKELKKALHSRQEKLPKETDQTKIQKEIEELETILERIKELENILEQIDSREKNFQKLIVLDETKTDIDDEKIQKETKELQKALERINSRQKGILSAIVHNRKILCNIEKRRKNLLEEIKEREKILSYIEKQQKTLNDTEKQQKILKDIEDQRKILSSIEKLQKTLSDTEKQQKNSPEDLKKQKKILKDIEDQRKTLSNIQKQQKTLSDTEKQQKISPEDLEKQQKILRDIEDQRKILQKEIEERQKSLLIDQDKRKTILNDIEDQRENLLMDIKDKWGNFLKNIDNIQENVRRVVEERREMFQKIYGTRQKVPEGEPKDIDAALEHLNRRKQHEPEIDNDGIENEIKDNEIHNVIEELRKVLQRINSRQNAIMADIECNQSILSEIEKRRKTLLSEIYFQQKILSDIRKQQRTLSGDTEKQQEIPPEDFEKHEFSPEDIEKQQKIVKDIMDQRKILKDTDELQKTLRKEIEEHYEIFPKAIEPQLKTLRYIDKQRKTLQNYVETRQKILRDIEEEHKIPPSNVEAELKILKNIEKRQKILPHDIDVQLNILRDIDDRRKNLKDLEIQEQALLEDIKFQQKILDYIDNRRKALRDIDFQKKSLENTDDQKEKLKDIEIQEKALLEATKIQKEILLKDIKDNYLKSLLNREHNFPYPRLNNDSWHNNTKDGIIYGAYLLENQFSLQFKHILEFMNNRAFHETEFIYKKFAECFSDQLKHDKLHSKSEFISRYDESETLSLLKDLLGKAKDKPLLSLKKALIPMKPKNPNAKVQSPSPISDDDGILFVLREIIERLDEKRANQSADTNSGTNSSSPIADEDEISSLLKDVLNQMKFQKRSHWPLYNSSGFASKLLGNNKEALGLLRLLRDVIRRVDEKRADPFADTTPDTSVEVESSLPISDKDETLSLLKNVLAQMKRENPNAKVQFPSPTSDDDETLLLLKEIIERLDEKRANQSAATNSETNSSSPITDEYKISSLLQDVLNQMRFQKGSYRLLYNTSKFASPLSYDYEVSLLLRDVIRRVDEKRADPFADTNPDTSVEVESSLPMLSEDEAFLVLKDLIERMNKKHADQSENTSAKSAKYETLSLLKDVLAEMYHGNCADQFPSLTSEDDKPLLLLKDVIERFIKVRTDPSENTRATKENFSSMSDKNEPQLLLNDVLRQMDYERYIDQLAKTKQKIEFSSSMSNEGETLSLLEILITKTDINHVSSLVYQILEAIFQIKKQFAKIGYIRRDFIASWGKFAREKIMSAFFEIPETGSEQKTTPESSKTPQTDSEQKTTPKSSKTPQTGSEQETTSESSKTPQTGSEANITWADFKGIMVEYDKFVESNPSLSERLKTSKSKFNADLSEPFKVIDPLYEWLVDAIEKVHLILVPYEPKETENVYVDVEQLIAERSPKLAADRNVKTKISDEKSSKTDSASKFHTVSMGPMMSIEEEKPQPTKQIQTQTEVEQDSDSDVEPVARPREDPIKDSVWRKKFVGSLPQLEFKNVQNFYSICEELEKIIQSLSNWFQTSSLEEMMKTTKTIEEHTRYLQWWYDTLQNSTFVSRSNGKDSEVVLTPFSQPLKDTLKRGIKVASSYLKWRDIFYKMIIQIFLYSPNDQFYTWDPASIRTAVGTGYLCDVDYSVLLSDTWKSWRDFADATTPPKPSDSGSNISTQMFAKIQSIQNLRHYVELLIDRLHDSCKAVCADVLAFTFLPGFKQIVDNESSPFFVDKAQQTNRDCWAPFEISLFYEITERDQNDCKIVSRKMNICSVISRTNSIDFIERRVRGAVTALLPYASKFTVVVTHISALVYKLDPCFKPPSSTRSRPNSSSVPKRNSNIAESIVKGSTFFEELVKRHLKLLSGKDGYLHRNKNISKALVVLNMAFTHPQFSTLSFSSIPCPISISPFKLLIDPNHVIRSLHLHDQEIRRIVPPTFDLKSFPVRFTLDFYVYETQCDIATIPPSNSSIHADSSNTRSPISMTIVEPLPEPIKLQGTLKMENTLSRGASYPAPNQYDAPMKKLLDGITQGFDESRFKEATPSPAASTNHILKNPYASRPVDPSSIVPESN